MSLRLTVASDCSDRATHTEVSSQSTRIGCSSFKVRVSSASSAPTGSSCRAATTDCRFSSDSLDGLLGTAETKGCFLRT